MSDPSRINRFGEAVALLLFAALVVFLLTGASGITTGLPASLLITGGVIALCQYRERRGMPLHRVWIITASLIAGFWIFVSLIHAGCAQWPLARSGNLKEYFYLLLSHLLFGFTVFSCFLWIGARHADFSLLRWGAWRRDGRITLPTAFLFMTALATGIWAAGTVIRTPLPMNEWTGWFVIIALLKAALTGGIEELVHRGIIMPVAIERFGARGGIIVQSLIYTSFHLYLGAAFFGHAGFLAGVFALGILFGMVTLSTRGIGWAATVHVAINVVIEWQNLS